MEPSESTTLNYGSIYRSSYSYLGVIRRSDAEKLLIRIGCHRWRFGGFERLPRAW